MRGMVTGGPTLDGALGREKALFAKLERTLDDIEQSPELLSTLAQMLRRLVDDFREELGLVGGRIYVRRGSWYVLQKQVPEDIAPHDFRIPISYPPLEELLDRGFVFHYMTDPGVDPTIEARLGGRTFAAICVGEACRHVCAFSLRDSSDRERVITMLNTIRHVVNLKLRKDQLEGRVAQSRLIQLSLLPAIPPAFGEFDLWAQSQPAEEVGGDLYDFIRVSERTLGLAIADAAGHGLPAALQARDAIIGLRMGVEENLRLTATVAKLNRVIHRSALASKFISLFYAELDLNGTLVFCNAGHPPPLLRTHRGIERLSRGGLVLGPHPEAEYERGYTQMEPGDVLLAYTDGIVEAEDSSGNMLEIAGLEHLLGSGPHASARVLVESVFDAVRRHSGTDFPTDDQTVLAVVRRPAP